MTDDQSEIDQLEDDDLEIDVTNYSQYLTAERPAKGDDEYADELPAGQDDESDESAVGERDDYDPELEVVVPDEDIPAERAL